MENRFDIAIAGAGPAGLAAAVTAMSLRKDLKVLVLEKMSQPAKKLAASGNGRGNLSNLQCSCRDEVLDFFKEAGIAVRADEAGRIYPYSEEAKSVAAVLCKRAEKLGAVIMTDSEVCNAEADPQGGFRIFVHSKKGKEEIFRAEKLLIATGGKSYAVYGSTGDGYRLARRLGHNVAPLVPSLTAVETEESLEGLKGLRMKAEVSLMQKGDIIFRERGEVQFREDCLSGICIMNMSAFLPVRRTADGREEKDNDERQEKPECRIMINTVPDFTAAGLIAFLREKASMDVSVSELTETIVKKPAADYILKRLSMDGGKPASRLGMKDIIEIANGLRCLEFTPAGRKGWKEAQVTKGGVLLEEIDMKTMESRVISGLYFAGEVTDYDGPCGGYNLHNAWLGGIRAGRAMAQCPGEITE